MTFSTRSLYRVAVDSPTYMTQDVTAQEQATACQNRQCRDPVGEGWWGGVVEGCHISRLGIVNCVNEK